MTAFGDEFEKILTGARCHAIPLSALHGDNVITRSDSDALVSMARACWSIWETVNVTRDLTALPFRFPVQLVLRPNDAFRGYSGQLASGTVRVGDRVAAWPSGRAAHVKRIVTYDGDLDMAFCADVGDADARRRDRRQPW